MFNVFANSNLALQSDYSYSKIDNRGKFPIVKDPVMDEQSKHTFSNRVNTYREIEELEELKQASGEPLKTLAAYKPHRLALQETIVGVSTMIRTTGEKDMRAKVETLYPQIERETRMLEKDLENWRNGKLYNEVFDAVKALAQGIDIKDMPHAEAIKAKWEQVQSRIKSGEYVPSYTNGTDEQDMIIALAQDEIFNKTASSRISMLVNKNVTRAIQKGDMEAINIPEQEYRIGFMLFGGAASGKSTSVRIFQNMARLKNLDCRDFVKINTDSYRKLLIDENSIDAQDFSGLTQEEASLIHNKVYERLLKLKDEGRCPHIMVDQVYPDQDKIDLALANDGFAFTLGISRDVGEAIWASEARGNATGRYVDTEALLSMHKGVALALPKLIADNVDKDIRLEIRDNNVFIDDKDKETEPSLIFEINLSTKKATILDTEKLQKYIFNTCINTKAKNKDELYNFSKMPSIDEYLKPLSDAGIEIEYPQDCLDKKHIDNQKFMFYNTQKYR